MGFGNYYGGYTPPMGGNFGGAMQDNLSQYRAAQTQNQQNMSGAVWVQGEVGAKSYPVAPGNSVVLMDSEAARFYIKTADISGVPMPLRVFEFKEVGGAPTSTADMSQFVTKEELQEALSKLKGETENG
jgi:hypothetical protein